MRKIAIIGSTGSIGRQALDLVRRLPDHLQVTALSAGRDAVALAEQVREFRPQFVGLKDARQEEIIRSACQQVGAVYRVGEASATWVAQQPGAERVLLAVTGAAGIEPALTALQSGKDLALANKESLIAAGEILVKTAQEHQVSILPVDSEHSAIFQCLQGERLESVNRIILTASGGAFRDWPPEKLSSVTPEQALDHPTWRMGAKITVDCATLMNKGLEIIETRWLFNLPVDRIDTVLHRQSIVHSLVEFSDGSVKAQLSLPDMRMPIQYALLYPKRVAWDAPRLDLIKIQQLTFEELNLERYPCLQLARYAAEQGGSLPAVMSAADEVAVEAFLQRRIRFTDIAQVIEWVMNRHTPLSQPSLAQIFEADRWARQEAERAIRQIA